MARFLVRRLAGHAVLVLVASSLAYLLAAAVLDPRGNYEGRQPPPPPEVVDAVLTESNLNDDAPLAQRYAVWASGVLCGDLGRTWDGREVGAEMARRVGVNLRLMSIGLVAGSVAGVALGAWAGLRRGRGADRLLTLWSYTVISVPTVVLAAALQACALWLNSAAGADLLRATGEYTPGLDAGMWGSAADRARHLLLPSLALALPQIAVHSRYQRELIAEAAGADFVRTARAKGLTLRAALRRHALRTTLGPSVTLFGYSFAALFTGTVFVEQVFGWHGVGGLLIDAIAEGDVNVVAAVCTFGALCVSVAGLLADTARGLLDPRVRT
ncbi:peptide/nickel transport system permease protein [Murinocardiopsis flavida]|uniref:Peptide/nickel transport system permease protein n=1 Tax=Murinocardiopsis flavida TaxID=645275 RepID=A0A2P8DUT4_9ACTN|nr:ABC transporter permease [Murinocardiopsis flavida]PSL00976.1 peptide/nickel transport system permease protein [Murinocardiopsis flavida]